MAARVGAALAAAGIAFAVTSPFVVIHARDAMKDLAAERQHMERGHFGVDEEPGWRAYARELPRVAGWPVLVAATAGAVLAVRRRRHEVLVTLALVAAASVVLGASRLHADRYLLPLLPALVLLAAWFPAELVRARTIGAQRVMLAAAAVLFAAPGAAGLPAVWARAHGDPRSDARAWIEKNLAPGSLVALEAWGPDLLEPVDLWGLAPDVRKRFLDRKARPLYAVLNLPTYQVMPELSEAFYDLRLYPEVDAFVLSSDVGDRYRKDPQRFAVQCAFYERLAATAGKAAEFGGTERGPRITVWRAPAARPPFGDRAAVAGMPPLARELRRPAPGEAAFYRDAGLLYETWGHFPPAVEAYARAFVAPEWSPGTAPAIASGLVRCLRKQGRAADAAVAAERVASRCTDPAEAAEIRALAARVRAEIAAQPPR
jgi:hypothetical protein